MRVVNRKMNKLFASTTTSIPSLSNGTMEPGDKVKTGKIIKSKLFEIYFGNKNHESINIAIIFENSICFG